MQSGSFFSLLICVVVIAPAIGETAAEYKIKKLSRKSVSETSFRNYRIGAAVYLVSENWQKVRQDRKCHFNSSLDSLVTFWLPRNKYPVILMNTRAWTRSEMKSIRTLWLEIDFFFINIYSIFHTPPTNNTFEDRLNPLSDKNYKQMCAFWSAGFLRVPILKTFRYILRMDDDTCIASRINYDIFEDMHSLNVHYAFHSLFLDLKHVVVGLDQFVRDYINSTRINIANKHLYDNSYKLNQNRKWSFSTNLEVVDMKRFRQPDIQHFIQAVTESNYIFHRRWGDAPLRFIIGWLFLGPSQILWLCDFVYQHSNWPQFELCPHRSASINAVLNAMGQALT